MTNLQRIRKERGISQAELSERARISISTLQHYEQGYRDINGAAVETVFRIADALGCDPRELMEKEGKKDE